jgi:hypothetical protein
MDIYESLLSQTDMLNEKIARQLFEVLPEQGPVVLIMDNNGNTWPSDSEEFAKLGINESHLKELRTKIDDGVEPVVTYTNECSIIASQLATETSHWGYIFIALPQYSPESALINITLIETMLNQFNLIAKLLEKNNLLYETQMTSHCKRAPSEIALN